MTNLELIGTNWQSLYHQYISLGYMYLQVGPGDRYVGR